jgi:sulfonate transport system permease protein
MKVTLALSFSALVVAEMMGASTGLGFMIINAKAWFKMSDMFLAIVLIGLLYTIFHSVLTLLEKVLFQWKAEVGSAVEK